MTIGTSAPPRAADWQRGVLHSILMTICFAAIDALAKALGPELPVLQLVWGRYFFHFAMFAPFVLTRARARPLFATRRLGLQLVRSLLLVGSTFTFWWGLLYLPLAQAITIGFVAPLMVTALSVPLLGERVGAHRWGAVVVGLVGVLIVIRPGAEAVHWAVALPVATAALYALYQIATRVLSRTDPMLTTLFFTGLGGAVVTTALLPFVWEPMTLRQWLLLACLGGLGGLGHLFLVMAFATAPASLLAPFNYLTLIWASLIGYVAFADVPSGATVVGAAVIALSGIYIVHRERKNRPAPG